MKLPDSERKNLVVGPGLLSVEQYRTSMALAKQLPVLNVEKAFFKVVGERYITPQSIVHFVIKARVIPPGMTGIPPVNELDLEDIDPVEGDMDAILGRASEKKIKQADGTVKVEKKEEKSVQPPLAYAPYYARDQPTRWSVFLTDSKQGKMVVPPNTFATFDQELYTEDGRPTFNVQTLKMQFGAPPQAGQYTFVMHLICDSYIGMDSKMEVTLKVEEMEAAAEIQEEDEISEPEEGMSYMLHCLLLNCSY
jgi:translocation protein SEC63